RSRRGLPRPGFQVKDENFSLTWTPETLLPQVRPVGLYAGNRIARICELPPFPSAVVDSENKGRKRSETFLPPKDSERRGSTMRRWMRALLATGAATLAAAGCVTAAMIVAPTAKAA